MPRLFSLLSSFVAVGLALFAVPAAAAPDFIPLVAYLEDDNGPVNGDVDVVVEPSAGARVVVAGSVVGGAVVGEASVGDGAVIESGAAVAARSSVAPKTTVPAGSLFGGNPAVFLRQLSSEEVAAMSKTVDSAKAMAPSHAAECNKTFAEIELEKKDYVWKLPKVNKDPLGLLSEQRAVYW